MLRLLLLGACALLAFPQIVFSQSGRYIPFPSNFEKLDSKSKQYFLKSIETNTDTYFRSPDYKQVIAGYVVSNNPENINSCNNLTLDHKPALNTIKVQRKLLFARVNDRHPLVGNWTQKVSFSGCGRKFTFTLDLTADKGKRPNVTYDSKN